MVQSKYELSEEDRIAQALDPRGFFELRYTKLQEEAEGLEKFVYKLFGPDVVKSVTFAIDPLHKFKYLTHGVSTVTRMRDWQSVAPATKKVLRKNTTIHWFQDPNTATLDEFQDREPLRNTTTVTLDDTLGFTSQQAIYGRIHDTSISTRPIQVEEGELLLWKPLVFSPDRYLRWVSNEDIAYFNTVPAHPYKDVQIRLKVRDGVGPAARILPTSINTIRDTEITLGDNAIGNHVLRMVSNCMSQSRQFGITYSVAELKDIPLTLKNAVESIMEVSKKAKRDRLKGDIFLRGDRRYSSGYLNAVFGWLPVYRDVVKMLRTPARVSKKINLLLARQGLPTTFRDSFKYIEPLSSPPGFTYDTYAPEETQISIGTTGTRTVEMRCMVNQTVELPSIASPQLRKDLLVKLWGLDPDPEDVYNLVPWTWLVDWFGGLGDYVKAYNVVNTDPSIINYGFMTYDSVIEIRTDRVGRVTYSLNTKNVPPIGDPGITVIKNYDTTHSSVLRSNLQLRRSIGNAFDMRPSYELSEFTGSQLAILGALLTLRNKTAK
jgi:hypothetical protein